MKPCDTIRAHLSALVDGELAPLESMAMRRHLAQCSACQSTFASLERLKLAVHVSGGSLVAGSSLDERLRTAVHRRRFGHRAAVLARWTLPLAAAAALAWFLAADRLAFSPSPGPPLAAVTLDGPVFDSLVFRHTEGASNPLLTELESTGVIVAFDHLPGNLLGTQAERLRVVTASLTDCDLSESGASLAVFHSDRTTLPPAITAALDATGLFVDVVRGTEVRVTRSGDRLFVLLTEIWADPQRTPI